jgi:hypothetical protein
MSLTFEYGRSEQDVLAIQALSGDVDDGDEDEDLATTD